MINESYTVKDICIWNTSEIGHSCEIILTFETRSHETLICS